MGEWEIVTEGGIRLAIELYGAEVLECSADFIGRYPVVVPLASGVEDTLMPMEKRCITS
mgnify:CR=1 FL=1|tara:strand:+ start:16160 stop:16336 length:177 start_codon:yes stop_codon:yes gene_type:complete